MAVSTESAFSVADLERALAGADPAALLVPPRILRRVIKKDRGLTGLGLQVPHHKSYVIARDDLLRIAGRDELGVPAGRELPEVVLLFPRPEPARVAARPRGQTLVKYWRLLFHARVHVALRGRVAARRPGGAPSGETPGGPPPEGEPDEDGVRERVRRIGPVAFDEARAVLAQEHFLLPPGDTPTAYEEFAALYLELRHFE